MLLKILTPFGIIEDGVSVTHYEQITALLAAFAGA